MELLRSGRDPEQIADRQGVSLATILQYLDQMIGEGRLRWSDVLFSLDKERRRKPKTAAQHLIVAKYGNAADALGDMYEDLRRIELTLQSQIRIVLQKKFGTGENGWWRRCLSLNLRQKLQCRREEDETPGDAYQYTDLLDIAEVLDKNWGHLAGEIVSNSAEKQSLLADLRRLNQIRRKVMHPVRSEPPSEDEFEFVRSVRARFRI